MNSAEGVLQPCANDHVYIDQSMGQEVGDRGQFSNFVLLPQDHGAEFFDATLGFVNEVLQVSKRTHPNLLLLIPSKSKLQSRLRPVDTFVTVGSV